MKLEVRCQYDNVTPNGLSKKAICVVLQWFYDNVTPNRDAHVKTLTCLKFLVFFHAARFLPRHFFTSCRITMNRRTLHSPGPK